MVFNCTALYCVREVFMYFICKYGLNCTVLYYVRDNSPWWAHVHCKSNLTINKLSYSYSYSDASTVSNAFFRSKNTALVS